MTEKEIKRFIEDSRKMGPGTFTKSIKKQAGDPAEVNNGIISGYFSTFDHDKGDSYGDVVRKGAFLESIAKRKASRKPFPMCYNHDFNQIIGKVLDIGEDYKGAYFTAEFFPTERAQEIRSIVQSGVLWQFSFAYDILEQGKIKAGNGEMVNELRKLELYEISIVMIPANPRATISDIKSENLGNLSPELCAMRNRALYKIEEINNEQTAKRARLLRKIENIDLYGTTYGK